MNPLSVAQRAFAHLTLTPGERALLKFGEGTLISALFAGIVAANTAISTNGQSVNLKAVLGVGISAFAMTCYNTLRKYLGAQGETSPAPISAPTPAPAPSDAPAPQA